MDFYHVLNRGVEKRTLFMNDSDFLRFVHDLWEFNDSHRVLNVGYALNRSPGKGAPATKNAVRERNRIVDIHAWVLMKNHYHMLLSERVEGGIAKFLQKLNIGYAKYFNEKYSRVGTLFQGRTKKILIKRDAHFMHILNYIHFNPLDYLSGARDWRERRVESSARALNHLEKYRWSSFPDYLGKQNFPSILTTGFFKNASGDYAAEAKRYLKDLDISPIKGFSLE
jgi:putative transposase